MLRSREGDLFSNPPLSFSSTAEISLFDSNPWMKTAPWRFREIKCSSGKMWGAFMKKFSCGEMFCSPQHFSTSVTVLMFGFLQGLVLCCWCLEPLSVGGVIYSQRADLGMSVFVFKYVESRCYHTQLHLHRLWLVYCLSNRGNSKTFLHHWPNQKSAS